MSIGSTKIVPVTFPSGSATSNEIDLGRGFGKVVFDITGVTESCHFTVAGTSGGTYRMVRHPVASGMSAPQTATVGTAASGGLTEVPLNGYRFVKVVAAAAITDGGTAKLHVADV